MTYSPEVDAVAITLATSGRRPVTREISPGVYGDYDGDRLVAIEILDASSRYSVEELAAMGSPETWLTLEEAAEEAAAEGDPISAITLRGLLNAGRIQGKKQGRDWLIAGSALWSYLENRVPAGRPPARPAAVGSSGGIRSTRPDAAPARRLGGKEYGVTMAKSPKNEQTSARVASKASRILSNPKSSKAAKSVAGSALTQARNKKK